MHEMSTAPGGDHATTQAFLTGENRRIANWCLGVLAVLSTGSLIGVASSLYLANHHPLLLIALSPLGRHLILVAPTLDPLVFIAVAVGRRLLFCIPCFFLGRAFGPRTIVWLETRWPRATGFLRWLERTFERASRLVLVLLPGPGTSAIAGSAGTRLAVFLPFLTLGFVLNAILVLGIAEWLSEPIEAALALIEDYWIPGTVILIVGIVLYRSRQRRSARRLLPTRSK
jgi:membrane protein DedA with SNARE-associated domain